MKRPRTTDRRPPTAVTTENRPLTIGRRRLHEGLWLLLAFSLLLTGCVGIEAPLLPLPAPAATPTSTATPIPQPTAPPTATPSPTVTPSATPTPRVVVLRTPAPPGTPAPEPTAAGRLIAYTDHLDFYAEPGSYWAARIPQVAGIIETDYWEIARRLQTTLPEERVQVSFQDPSTSPLVRGMQCPARGLYYGETENGPLMTIFADENTSLVQVLAVAAHELAHHLTSYKWGPGGDIILSEGLANWATRERWSAWQGWPSFDDAVRAYRRNGIYMPLTQTLIFDPRQTQELGLRDCFALRDLRYSEWASFVGFLIDRYGMEVITELWEAAPENAHPSPGSPVPTVDYRRVLGRDLEDLEREWLRWLEVLQEARHPTLAIPQTVLGSAPATLLLLPL